jgi:hypothetical protein
MTEPPEDRARDITDDDPGVIAIIDRTEAALRDMVAGVRAALAEGSSPAQMISELAAGAVDQLASGGEQASGIPALFAVAVVKLAQQVED